MLYNLYFLPYDQFIPTIIKIGKGHSFLKKPQITALEIWPAQCFNEKFL